MIIPKDHLIRRWLRVLVPLASLLLGPVASARPLGPRIDHAAGITTFRVFAPRATALTLDVFASPRAGPGSPAARTGPGRTPPPGGTPSNGRASPHRSGEPRSFPMTRDPDGVWSVDVAGDLTGHSYAFRADGPRGAGDFFDPARPLSDPYARANVGHDGRSLLVDGSFSWRDQAYRRPAPGELIVYEVHVKDFSFHPSSGVTDPSKRGKYLGLVEDRGDGRLLSHLEELGITAVELMPVHEFDHTAAPPGHINHWGYMTSHFFAPESSYASGTDRGEAVRELKAAVDAFHRSGIAVILDVVYNHTHEGDAAGVVTSFKGLDAPYYYRMSDDRGTFFNGTGTGNEIRSESPRARQLILDSLRYFVDAFHIDGFRLDLGASLDLETLRAIESELPGVILIAEPWTADWSRRQWDRSELWQGRWGLWNDGYRDNVHALVSGHSVRDELMSAIAGSCFWGAGSPMGSVNYIEAHDGATMADRVRLDQARHRLGAVALFTSMGIPMIHQGQEFMKSKKGDHNSYDQDNEINWIDWTLKDANRPIFDFFRGLIAIRRTHRALRYDRCLDDGDISWLRPGNARALGYLLQGPGGEPDVLVLLNGDPADQVSFALPAAGDWPILCNGDRAAADGSLGTASGDYRVPPMTGVILRSP